MESPECVTIRRPNGIGQGMIGVSMQRMVRGSLFGIAIVVASACAAPASAGDDGAAPLWVGVSSIFTPFLGLGNGKDEKAPIDYREHGKIVLPPKIELPPPSAAAAPRLAPDWPVNQEVERKRLKKEAEQKQIAGQGDARLRYTHPFPPNTPVTVRASDQVLPSAPVKSETSTLGNLNPLGWIGLGKSQTALGPEPDREWLTDPPKGYRAPAGQGAN